MIVASTLAEIGAAFSNSDETSATPVHRTGEIKRGRSVDRPLCFTQIEELALAETFRSELERNIFVGDFGTGWGVTAATTASEALFGAGWIVEIATATRRAACAGSSAIGAASEHAEVARDDFEARALLSFLVLPFARLDAALNE